MKAERPKCRYCGLPLRRARYREGFGSYGDNLFCGLTCGYSFGILLADQYPKVRFIVAKRLANAKEMAERARQRAKERRGETPVRDTHAKEPAT